MKNISRIVLIFLILSISAFAQNYKIIESTNDHIKIEFNFENSYRVIDTLIDGKTFQYISNGNFSLRKIGEPWLPSFYVDLGIPFNSTPKVKLLSIDKVVYQNKFILPLPKYDPSEKQLSINDLDEKIYGTNSFFPSQSAEVIDDYVYRYSRVVVLNSSPFQFNPVTKELILNKKIQVEVDFNTSSSILAQSVGRINDPQTNSFINNFVVNKQQAINWTGVRKPATLSKTASTQNYWYNPNKNYYQIYLNKKGIYRITYDQLAAAGMQINNVPLNKLELYNNGSEVPIYITDLNNDGIFNSGDYFEFAGYPPIATPYAAQNIYNNDNVYFFSVQADSDGLRYKITDGYPNTWDRTFQTNLTTLHFERDSLYENLGYAGDDHRDFWLWDNITGQNGNVQHDFEYTFNSLKEMNADSAYITIKVQLQGLTTSASCSENHKAYVSLNSMPIDAISWSAQNTATFVRTIKIANDSFHLYPTGNLLQVKVLGDACPTINSDEVAVNWFEINYWRDNRADTNHIDFSSPPNVNGKIEFWTWRWIRDSIKVFIPQKNEIIKNALVPHDQYNSAIFVDSVRSNLPVDYFCTGYDYYLSPDSIVQSVQSDLRNTNNGADYIIIAHPNFKSVAEKLANFRQNNFPDSTITNPRIKIVYVNQIYNEFSNGLLDPFALQAFVQYAFYNWQKPSPTYVVLLGDMSHDYMHLLSSSRPNFVPSIPFYTYTYGEGVSDNMIVAVSGNSIHPDLAIGRLSCETVDEGNVLVDKLINYPADNSKDWKRNVLLLSSGIDQADEAALGLNQASVQLEQTYLVPNGFKSTKVMRYPNQPDYIPFQGGGPEIRDKIDQGTVLTNYYGHGGGYQWDLTFLNDDIYLLNNGGRLPLILSLTCYTAHFDDQDVFGEQFNKVPGKGSIGFFGNVGLTYWNVATNFDNDIFREIFDNKNFISGKVFQYFKDYEPAYGYNTSQIALLTYLGDPLFKLALPNKPDFSVSSSDITLTKDNAVVNDTLQVKVNVQNYGIVFPNDSVTVQLFVQSSDTSYQLAAQKLPSFSLEDSVYFTWVPAKPGLFTLTAKVNEINIITEEDHSDNSASVSFPVYNLNNPNILSPIDGYSTSNNYVEFKIADIVGNLNYNLSYYIQVDTNLTFSSSINSPTLFGSDGLVNWKLPNLNKGIYYWRTRIYDGKDSSGWSQPRTFSITNSNQNGYYIYGKQFGMFNSYNMNVSDSGIVLNTNYLPPKPSNKTFIEDFNYSPSSFDSTGFTAIATDGTYLYCGNIWYYALRNNSNGFSNIYKFGTGYNGTVKGQYYGTLPNFFAPIKDVMFYFRDGYIYVADGDPYSLLRVDKITGDTTRIRINSGMYRYDNTKIQNGSFYLAADSNYVYNLAIKDSIGNYKYFLRTFDPNNNWALAKPDMQLSGTSYTGFTNFFAADGYIFPYENYQSGFMRRLRLSDGVFEEEWVTCTPFQNYYAWCYDFVNNIVYASVFNPSGGTTKISKFKGRYLDGLGTVTTNAIGPASKWNSINFNIENSNQNPSFNAMLLGENSSTKLWDTVNTNLYTGYNIANMDANKYQFIKLNFNFWDSSFVSSSPVKLKSILVNYSSLPDISLAKGDLNFNSDSILQGVPLNINLKVHNYGLSNIDSSTVKLFLNSAGSPFFTKNISILADSSVDINTTLSTTNLNSLNDISAEADYSGREFYSFNNVIDNKFFVLRDSIKPTFSITFDGKEIVNGDIVSAKPKIVFSLKDNSPIPLDTTDFSIVFDNNPFIFNSSNVQFSYNPYPNSQANITWNPKLTDGQHTLYIMTKDASGNYSDSTAVQIMFFVYNQSDILNVYNFPNPFKTETYFTFQLTGSNVPDELRIKIYTVAGRLIREINIPPSELHLGFNRISWDGRDQDGDNIANGIYFYKIIYKNGDVVKDVTQKLARVQ